jgi:hypothetical protein
MRDAGVRKATGVLILKIFYLRLDASQQRNLLPIHAVDFWHILFVACYEVDQVFKKVTRVGTS